MPAVSQALIDFANQRRQEPAPGIEVIVTPRYRATVQPDFPIPGPNSVSWIRCRAEEADELIREARAIFAARQLPFAWILEPGVEPSDFAAHLLANGVHPDPHDGEAQVMVLPIEATVEAPPIAGLEIQDALVDLETFRKADEAAAEAFGQETQGRGARKENSPLPVQGRGSGRGAWKNDSPEYLSMLERRRQNFRAEGNRHWLLATVDGEPAGAAGIILHPPGGAIINGGSVRPKFRGRGIYRAMVAARLDIARQAGVAGLCVWGGNMSAPILSGLGFEKVGWRRFYVDTTTV